MLSLMGRAWRRAGRSEERVYGYLWLPGGASREVPVWQAPLV